jgi:hypothetical protein
LERGVDIVERGVDIVLTEIAEQEPNSRCYVSRMLTLALPAPDIPKAILERRGPM